METEQQKAIHQFGVFELDLRTGELRKHGIRLKLQQQPLQVLSILVGRAGEVITREDIQKALWPEDTYVDFDNAINSSIRKLREALGDNADSPRFIETLPRRGYRFIYPVSHGLTSINSQVESLTPASKRRGRWRVLAAGGLVVLAAGLAFWLSNSKPKTERVDALLSAVPFTTYPGWDNLPNFSPDGSRVAFSRQQQGADFPDVYVKLLGTGEPVRLSSAAGFGPVWSPDGHFIAFLRPIDVHHAAVVIIPTIGGRERDLTRIAFNASFSLGSRLGWALCSPFLTWSPDGKWLLTLDQKVAGSVEPHDIVRVSVESGEKRSLTSPSHSNLGDGGLALSPDGKRLAFTRDSGFWARDIYVVPVSDDLILRAKPERLTFDNKPINGMAWTRDGKHLVFSSPRNGRQQLWKIAAQRGSDPVRLNLTEDEISDVAISRDGKHLLYSHDIEDQNIYRASLNAQHAAEPMKFIASTRRDIQGYYSPDGKRIVFESNRSGAEEIWICDADGSNPVQLTHFGNAWAGSPMWSPDGEKIAFGANAAGNWDIYVVSSGGGKPKRLTDDGADESWPSWSRDGKWIYYFSNRGKQGQIWKMPVNGGPEIQVTKNGGFWSNESLDGKDLYYVNDEGLWRIPVSGEAEVRIAEAYFFAPAKNGIYYAGLQNPNLWGSTFPLYFLDFKTQQTRTAGVLPGPFGDGNMDVSPDGRWLTYPKFDREGSELMLVENFQ
jgi:Tol biopolymer transport system component/DNA-binding winged helix-turn-helix (wHTH) protein